MSGNRRRRENLMREDPRCYYCRVEVVYFFPHPMPLPDNFATIDHVNSRVLHPVRPLQGRTVLSCWRCNHIRNCRETFLLSLAERQARSKMHRPVRSLPDSTFESWSAARS
jgi:hypothetical protein